jgi:hypothetical protein
MNMYKNARLTPRGRERIAQRSKFRESDVAAEILQRQLKEVHEKLTRTRRKTEKVEARASTGHLIARSGLRTQVTDVFRFRSGSHQGAIAGLPQRLPAISPLPFWPAIALSSWATPLSPPSERAEPPYFSDTIGAVQPSGEDRVSFVDHVGGVLRVLWQCMGMGRYGA